MILVDSGPLIAAAISDDRDHRRCVDMFTALHLNSEKMLVPQTVVAEVAYAIQKQGSTDHKLLFLWAFVDGDLALVDLVPEDVTRIIDLVETYRDFPLGTTDAPSSQSPALPGSPWVTAWRGRAAVRRGGSRSRS